jgi:hypothetical protein
MFGGKFSYSSLLCRIEAKRVLDLHRVRPYFSYAATPAHMHVR